MSITKLSKITWCGLLRDKSKALENLQALGCLHIIPLSRDTELRQAVGPTQQTREALQFLFSTAYKRRQEHNLKKFDATAVEKNALELRDTIAQLTEERDSLAGRIEAVRPWGQFEFLPLEEMKGLRFWFYAVPHKDMKNVSSRKGIWKMVKKDNWFCYIVVIAKEEPDDMPVARVHAGSQSLTELEKRIDEVETQLDEFEAKRSELTRWCDLYQRNLFLLENQAQRSEVSAQTFDKEQLFALQAWAPKKNMEALRQSAKEFRAALTEQEPDANEPVPTLLENQPAVAGGADLVTFYMTPGYHMWDPSVVVFCSFALFFAIILSDAGYSLVMALFLGLKWKNMGLSATGKRMRNLLAAVLGTSTIWGIMVGSYFGITPPEGGFLIQLKVLDLNDAPTMMLISLSIGVIHICLANIMDAWRKRRSSALFVPVGWTFIILGGFIMWLSTMFTSAAEILMPTGKYTMIAGALMQVIFGAPNANIFKRIFGGIFSLTRFSTAFGDVLSYLRLFALGLASASLAITFNDLAKQIMEGMPGIGIFFAILIFLFGHVLNLVLSIVSGVVHGLRLNVIEFFNWSMYEDGRPFRPFVIKGGVHWNH